jgi:hypothetical protein
MSTRCAGVRWTNEARAWVNELLSALETAEAELLRLRAQLAERHGEHARLLLARDAEISRLGEAIAQGIPDWIPDDVAAATAAIRECAPQLAIGLVRARRILDGTPPASPSVETGADPDAKREIVYWDCDDGAESLTWTDPDEAVERYLDDIHPELPEALTVHGYARMAVSADGADPLDRVLEHIDEEHGDPDGDPTTPTPAMRAAEATFLAAVIAEYESWACETVTHQEIDVRAWLQEHDPDRLAEYDAKHSAVEPPVHPAEGYTHACAAHVGELLSDVRRQEVIRISEPSAAPSAPLGMPVAVSPHAPPGEVFLFSTVKGDDGTPRLDAAKVTGLEPSSPADAISRRNCLDKLTPAERAICDATQAVEALPPDVRLTDAVVLLVLARDRVADFVDGVASSAREEKTNG